MRARIFIFKLLFAIFGFRLAGWLGTNPLAGLGVGLLVGHILDYSATVRFYRWRARRAYQAAAKAQFEEHFTSSLFSMLGHICAVDGVIDKAEIAAVQHIMKEVFEFNKKQQKMAIEAFQSVRNNAPPFQSSAMRLFELYSQNPEILERAVHMLFNVAASDSSVNKKEDQLIRTAASIFGISDERYRAIRRPYVRSTVRSSTHSEQSTEETVELAPSLDECYAILGCTKDSGPDEIKKKYRKLVSSYHPDKIVSKDLPDDFIQFASQKFKNIQQAYECVKSEKGIK